MNPCLVAALATLLVAVGTCYASICSPLPALPRSAQPAQRVALKSRPFMERTPDEIVNLAWSALTLGDQHLASDVLKYCRECPISVMGEAAARKLGEEALDRIERLAHGQGDAY